MPITYYASFKEQLGFRPLAVADLQDLVLLAGKRVEGKAAVGMRSR